MRRLVLTLLLLSLVLGACVNVHPRYPHDALVWDESLVGEWRASGLDRELITLRVEPREVRVSGDDGRINPERPTVEFGSAEGEAREPAWPGSIQQYRLTYSTQRGGSWVLEGYLLESGGAQFLAFQRLDEFIEDNGGLVLPVHLLWKVERSGDELQFWSPTDAVAWVPAINWADSTDDGGDRPIPRRDPGDERQGIRVAESLDRVLEYHARHAGDGTFWQTEESMRFRRVGGEAGSTGDR